MKRLVEREMPKEIVLKPQDIQAIAQVKDADFSEAMTLDQLKEKIAQLTKG